MRSTDWPSRRAFQQKRCAATISTVKLKNVGSASLTACILGASMLFAQSAFAANTFEVPTASYPTIQAGIDAASDGDTVLVDPGTYTGDGNRDISFNGKAITVQGSGIGVTILDLQGASDGQHRAFLFTNAEGSGSVVQGFEIENGVADDGAAIFVATAPPAGGIVLTGPTITQCFFLNNRAGDLGGAIYLRNSNSTVSQCAFDSNSAVSFPQSESNQIGGAIEILSQPFPGSAAMPAGSSHAVKPKLGLKPAAIDPDAVKLVNNVFVNNEAGFDGAAVDITGVDGDQFNPINTAPVVYIDNCSFNSNFDDFDGGGDGATGTISYYGGDFTISDSILYGDTTASEITQLTNPDNSTILIQSSDIQGGIGSLPGTSNIDAEPHFFINGIDLRLPPTSPAVNAGATFETTPATDINGTTRDAKPDMGAFEYILDISPVDASFRQYLPFDNQLTLFRDSAGQQLRPHDFTATIDWGDGTTPSAGTITQPGGAGDFYYISGDHTYTVYGPQQLTVTVTDGTFSASKTSTVFVVPVDATHFTLGVPASTVAGTPVDAVVTALDDDGNVATAYSGTVHFTSDDPTATLPADTTLTNGTGTFQTTFIHAAKQTNLRARDTETSSITGATSIAVSPGTVTHFSVVAPRSAQTGVAFYALLAAKDQYENTNTTYNGTVHVSSTDANAVLPANFALTGGAKQISVKLRTPGVQTISLSEVSGPLTGTSGSIAVGATATQFLVTAPTTAVAGTPVQFTVYAKDTVGNTIPGYTGTVHFTSSDPNAVLPANTILTNGVGTFSATFKTAGSQAIYASDTVTATMKGGMTGIVVKGGAAATFSITVPETTAKGVAIVATVTARDAFGNAATGYTGTVHFTSSDPLAVLPANTTLSNGAKQVSVKLKTTGAQTISATDTASASLTGTSATVTVH